MIISIAGIRQLQCILLKVSLLFGVQVYDSVSFKQLLLPTEDTPIQGIYLVSPSFIMAALS